MCIRDSNALVAEVVDGQFGVGRHEKMAATNIDAAVKPFSNCLLYTSDAADERSSVDLGGRRIIKKKKKIRRGRRHMQM